tara:strand:+ start:15217 stop:15828 length:612 start_codon:yes stop_codon:yes gene_type:complete
MSDTKFNPRTVDWTGENPGIYLKETADGPWTGLMTFYRVCWSPCGPGHGIIVLDEPNVEKGYPEVNNFCIADNQELAKYLVDHFFSNFNSFKVSPGLKAMTMLPMTDVRREGDTRSTYSEVVTAKDLEVKATWKGLTTPYAVDFPAEVGPTKAHQMYSCFIDADDAEVTINGKPLKGGLTIRNAAGIDKSSAFLAFSETWLKV